MTQTSTETGTQTSTLIQSIGDLATTLGTNTKILANTLQSTGELAIAAGKAAGEAKALAMGNTGLVRNVGEVVHGLVPPAGAGLVKMDGTVLSVNGMYAEGIAKILGAKTSAPELFTAEEAWQAEVEATGVCGKFVHDTTNNTLRLPKTRGLSNETINPVAVGDLLVLANSVKDEAQVNVEQYTSDIGALSALVQSAIGRVDTLSESQVSFIRIKGTGKPVDSTLRGLDAATQRVVEAQVGDAFTFAHTGADVGRVVVNKDCIATVIGFGDAMPVTQNETGDANANFRLLVRRRVGSVTGQSNIVVDCRQFIKAKKHTGALDIPVTVQLKANDRISVESACYDADRGNSTLTLTLIEHPNTLALDSQAANMLTQITTQLQSIEARLAALENPGS